MNKPSEDAPGAPRFEHASPDFYLRELVTIVNKTGLTFPITLWVGGSVVSGYLIGGADYFEELGSSLETFFASAKVDDPMSIANSLVEPYRKHYEDIPDEDPPPTYIHLRNARVFAPGQNPMPSVGTIWRGRLSRVDGFSFGNLVPDAERRREPE
ncbi:MAG TPA: gas vesicle accessory protein GvpU [Nevskiaceae bacterium]|nr:gas vesicle accessory protein GvpU [Nevskiaceae bacterium]